MGGRQEEANTEAPVCCARKEMRNGGYGKACSRVEIHERDFGVNKILFLPRPSGHNMRGKEHNYGFTLISKASGRCYKDKIVFA